MILKQAEDEKLEKPTAKLCVECAQDIPTLAKRCHKCSSYQNWRRHLGPAQILLALLLSIIALSVSALSNKESIIDGVKSFVGKTEFKVKFGVGTIDEWNGTIIVSNNSENSLLINSFVCQLFPPIDKEAFQFGNEMESTSHTLGWPLRKDTVGTFLLSYDVDQEAFLMPNEQASFNISLKHITLARPGLSIDTHEAKSMCMLSGVDGNNQTVGSIVFLHPTHLLGFNVLSLLEKADYSELQEQDRRALVAHVNEVLSIKDN